MGEKFNAPDPGAEQSTTVPKQTQGATFGEAAGAIPPGGPGGGPHVGKAWLPSNFRLGQGDGAPADDPGAEQSTTADEASQRQFMKHVNFKSDSGEVAGAPADDPGAAQAKTTDAFMKMDHEQVADVQGEASRMAINEKGLPGHKPTK